MDWDVIQKVGLNVFVTVSVLSCCVWLVRTIIAIGNQHLTNTFASLQAIINQHNEERSKWLVTIEKFIDKIERGMEYQRNEHMKILAILEDLEQEIKLHSK